jgi:CTD kinase subunit beta
MSRVIIGLERLILETINFDFRTRCPQKSLPKVTKEIFGRGPEAKMLHDVGYVILLDMYKTFVPIKQTCHTMVLTALELAALLTGKQLDKINNIDPAAFTTTRGVVVESLLDILDLYTQHHKSTKLCAMFDLNKFIEIKIQINSEVESDPKLSRYAEWCDECEAKYLEQTSAPGPNPGLATSFPGSNSVKRSARGQGETLRYVFDAEEAKKEKEVVEGYFKDEFEEYVVEEEEAIPEPERGPRRDRNHGHGGYDSGWQPHHRNRQHGNSDRHRGGRRFH